MKNDKVLQQFIASQLKLHMVQKGIGRDEVAKQLGVTGSCISNLLSGRNNLTCRSISRLAGAIGCEIRLELHPTEQKIGA